MALIGGGIMSATLGALLKELQPEWNIQAYERLSDVALESSSPWNNAGTGHSALCELNYSPQQPDGSVDISKAIVVNEQFQVSRQFWSYLVDQGQLPEPSAFINATPHMSFVWGNANVEYLRKRYAAMKDHPLFAGLEYSEDPEQIRKWAPLIVDGRPADEPIAVTRVGLGSDIDFGRLTHLLFADLQSKGGGLHLGHTVTKLKRADTGGWLLKLKDANKAKSQVHARFVFVGAGGGALNLLQKSGIPEIKGFGGFPVSGQFLRTSNPEIVAHHQAKIYGQAEVGAPPMSVPHLDTRVVDGKASVMFGPYAGFSPKFLKSGSYLDLVKSIRLHNIIPLLAVAKDNVPLVKYLVGELLASKAKKFSSLQKYVPEATPEGWESITAGQRVQVIKKDPKKGGVLQFGTEVVTSADGSIAGLLGASPGASTAVPIMLEVITKCFPDRLEDWLPHIKQMIPTYGQKLSDNKSLADSTMTATAKTLGLTP